MDKVEREVTILSLGFQQYLNYVSVVLVSFVSFLLTLWVSTEFTTVAKKYLAMSTAEISIVCVALFHEKLRGLKKQIRSIQ